MGMIDREPCKAWRLLAAGLAMCGVMAGVGCESNSRAELNRRSTLDTEPEPAFAEVSDREAVTAPMTFDEPATSDADSPASESFVEQREPTVLTLGEPQPAPRPAPPARSITPPPAPAPAPATRTHTIARGDTLSELSQRYLGTARRWSEIVNANPGLQPNRLIVGETINIPGSGSEGGTGSPAASASGNGHTIARGDTLMKISQQYYGTTTRWREILDANPGVDPQKLYVGKTLVIP